LVIGGFLTSQNARGLPELAMASCVYYIPAAARSAPTWQCLATASAALPTAFRAASAQAMFVEDANTAEGARLYYAAEDATMLLTFELAVLHAVCLYVSMMALFVFL